MTLLWVLWACGGDQPAYWWDSGSSSTTDWSRTTTFECTSNERECRSNTEWFCSAGQWRQGDNCDAVGADGCFRDDGECVWCRELRNCDEYFDEAVQQCLCR